MSVESSDDDDSTNGYVEYVSSDSEELTDDNDETLLPKMLKFSDLSI